MHKKYASQGFTLISVSLDELENAENARRFLEKMNARFTNLQLDEEQEVWQKKFRFVGPPAMYVFDRQGRWVQYTSDRREIDFAEVEKQIVQMLQESR